MEDSQAAYEQWLSEVKINKSVVEKSPICFYVKIEPEQKGALLECLAKVKPMDNMQDMMNAALGLCLTNIYSGYYTTE